jgi:AraC-like DNA-binding protein
MEMNIINIATILASFIAFLFMVFLLSIKTERRLPNFMLAVYLFVFILDILSLVIIKYIYPLSPIAGMLISLTVLLTMPAIYLFVKSSIYRDLRLSPGSLVHLLPYFIAIIMLLPGYFVVHMKSDITPEMGSDFFNDPVLKRIYVLIYVQMATYYTLIIIELRQYRQLLIENYSNPNMGNYLWLFQFIILILALDIIGLVRNILRFSSSDIIFNYAGVFVVINVLIFISWVMIMSLKQPGMFTGIYSDTLLVRKMLVKNTSAPVISDESSQLIDRLKNHMESKEPYLDSSLSVYDLASQLDMKVRDLSLLINHTLNQHFFDFVNQYRIDKAKKILRDPENKQITVLEVLYEVGFNSKSSFNTVFKKQTGMTPTQFRSS